MITLGLEVFVTSFEGNDAQSPAPVVRLEHSIKTLDRRVRRLSAKRTRTYSDPCAQQGQIAKVVMKIRERYRDDDGTESAPALGVADHDRREVD